MDLGRGGRRGQQAGRGELEELAALALAGQRLLGEARVWVDDLGEVLKELSDKVQSFDEGLAKHEPGAGCENRARAELGLR